MATLDWETIAGYAYDAGLRGEPAAIAVAITQPESTRDPDRHNYNLSTGDDSWGLWQINMLGDLGPDRRTRYGLNSNDELLDPATNARVMYGESGGGANWIPWTTYNHGRHAAYMDDARAAVAAVEARGGNPTGALTSATGGGSTKAVDLGRSPDVLWGLPQTPDFDADRPLSANLDLLTIQGQGAASTLLADTLTGGSLSLSADDIAELTLEVGVHPSYLPALADQLPIGLVVDWADLMFTIAAHDFDDSDGYHFTMTARAQGPTSMRKRLGTNELQWARMSPTEVMGALAELSQLRFVGQGTNRRDLIIRKGPKGGGPQLPTSSSTETESDWDLGQRLAREEGFWLFESAGTLYFAAPSWLAWRLPHFDVRAGVLGDLRGIDDETKRGDASLSTSAHRALDDDVLPGLPPRTITVHLPRERGERVRPGMVADFDGFPYFTGAYLVSKVSWPPFDDGLEPVAVDLVEPKDPVPEPPADDVNADDTGDGTGTGDGSTSNGGSTATPTGTAGASALDMVTVALRQIGKAYVYGAEAALDDPDPTAFDCSELVQWACAQVGVTIADGSYAQLDAVTRIDVDQARGIRGALLFPQPDAHHVAISLGDGEHTVEAMGRQYGVVQGNIGDRFGAAGLIPGLDYGPRASTTGQPVRRT